MAEGTGSMRRDPDGFDGPVLELDGVTRTFGTERAVEGLSLSVEAGELVTLVGPSGCGKTTTLRLLAGLERPDAGTIRVRGEVVSGEGRFRQPHERGIGLTFQEFALFPHLSVRANVAFGVRERTVGEVDRRVDELLDLVDLSAYGDQHPDALSGGQRQRVALARSLAPEPDVLLLDEPFSNLDVGLRERMREEVERILTAAGVTAVSVTHDQEEALAMGDRVAVMHDGRIEQVGRPEAVFQFPETRFVAEFLGEADFLPGQVEDGGLETAIGTIDLDRLDGIGPADERRRVDVLVRPDDLRVTPTEGPRNDGRIVSRHYRGTSFLYAVELTSGDVVRCEHNHVDRFEPDRPVDVSLGASHALAWFPSAPTRNANERDGTDRP